MKPVDQLYQMYSHTKFEDIVVDADAEPELAKFVEQSNIKPRFSNYKTADLEHFARRIYELRENNRNNTAG
jgi:hypothetical protein